MKIQSGISLTPPTQEAKAQAQDAQLRDAAKLYETHFLNEMVKSMRSTVGQQDGLIKRNMAEKIFSEQLDQKYVDGWADRGGVGLADMIYNQIKEKYMGTKQQGFAPRPQVLPIQPKPNSLGIPPTESIQIQAIPTEPKDNKLSYRLTVPGAQGGGYDVRAPMPGRILSVQPLGQGWNSVRLDHGQGMSSELTFPGQVTDSATGGVLAAGEKLGALDPARPALAWNLEWT